MAHANPILSIAFLLGLTTLFLASPRVAGYGLLVNGFLCCSNTGNCDTTALPLSSQNVKLHCTKVNGDDVILDTSPSTVNGNVFFQVTLPANINASPSNVPCHLITAIPPATCSSVLNPGTKHLRADLTASGNPNSPPSGSYLNVVVGQWVVRRN